MLKHNIFDFEVGRIHVLPPLEDTVVVSLVPIRNHCRPLLHPSRVMAILHTSDAFWASDTKNENPPNQEKAFQSLQSALLALLFGIFKSRVELVQAVLFSQGITSKHLIILTHSTNRICSPLWRIWGFQILKKKNVPALALGQDTYVGFRTYK